MGSLMLFSVSSTASINLDDLGYTTDLKSCSSELFAILDLFKCLFYNEPHLTTTT